MKDADGIEYEFVCPNCGSTRQITQYRTRLWCYCRNGIWHLMELKEKEQ